MATIKDLAQRYGLEDYEQLLGGYPNAEKFITGLKDAAVRAVPTTEQMRDPNFIIDTAGLGGAIKAYHGTPHLFDRFDMSKIGTGEGAQAYGHGLYLAQDPSIAEIYRKNLAEKHESPKSAIYETSIQWPSAEREAMDPLGEHHLLDWYQPAEGYVKEAIPRKIRELQNARDAISSKYVDDEFNPNDLFSNLYSFPSNEDKAAMDKIAEEINMHKYMSNAFEKGAEGSVTYNKLIKMLGSPEKASEYLHSIDIPGIKYLDASSRNTDKGTRNFVTFGDEYPQIVKRAGSLDELQEKNLNKLLIEKYLSEGKLSPDDMTQYEQNALAMETPLLQRYNVANAEMQIPNTKQRAKSLGFMTQPSKEQYHLTRNDWENNIPDLTKSDLGFHTGSIDQANYRGKAFDDNAVGQSVIPISPHKYTNYLKLNDLGSFHADSIAPQLEKKKILAKGKAKQIQSAIDNDWKLTDQYDQQMRDVLSQHDIDAIKYANEQEGEGLSYAHINPSMIRSRFAAFDPLRKNSSSIMASGLLGDLALKYANDDEPKYAEGGSVKDLHDKYEESDYGYGNRPDNTKKGLGYFGELERPDGTGVMTEYSIGVPIHGKEMDIPTLVPTLTPEEVQHILNIKEGERIPRSIVNKAIDHAHKRIKEDKPVFATEKDLYADGGSVVEDLPFNDPDQLRLYHQAMKHYDDVIENTGGSKKMGNTEARINYNTTTKGDRDRDKDLHTLIADYGIDVGKGANINATMIKPMEAEGVYLGNLTGSVPVGEGRASLGLQGLHTKYSDGLSGYTAGYNGKVGGGDLSASYFEPADHNSAGRQVQLEYSMPFADGGSVSEFEDPAHERLYRRAMAHFDDMSAKQNFEDNDSMIASTILHPVEAAKRAGNAFMRSVDTAGGRPREILDESSAFPVGIVPSRDEQTQAALDLAGLAQTGAMPFAPSTGAGVLGTITIPKKRITVTDPERSAFPDIYDRPDEIARRAAQNVAEEDPAMKRLFGVNRDDLYEIRKAREEGNESPAIVMAANPKGAKVGPQVTTRRNANRIIDTLSEAMNYPDLYKGMTSWYENGPIYDRLAQISDTPIEDFKKFQTYTGMASPGSDVLTELNRGTAALTLANQGRLDDFIKYGGIKSVNRNNDFPEDLHGVKGHMYHLTAHAKPMKKYYESGEIQMETPKVPLYIQSSGVPETGYQTEYPVGDAHWSRAVGLGDVRTSQKYDASVSTPELLSLAPWWKGLSKKLGLNSVDSQALAWGTFAPATGVDTPVGASKLELLSRKIMEAARAYNITPEEARDMILTGKMYAPDINSLKSSKK